MSREFLHERVNKRAGLYVLLAITSTRRGFLFCFFFLMFYTLDSLHILLEENILDLEICLKIIKPQLLFKEMSSQIYFDLTSVILKLLELKQHSFVWEDMRIGWGGYRAEIIGSDASVQSDCFPNIHFRSTWVGVSFLEKRDLTVECIGAESGLYTLTLN